MSSGNSSYDDTGVVVAHVVVRPLRTVESTVTALAKGDDTARMPAQTVRELREMATSFNVMLDDDAAALEILREEESRARRFVSDVSHELRSPLAALVPAAEILDEELADDTSPRGRSARIVSREITRLADLVEDLLEMTQQDAGVGAVTVTDTDIADLVAAALEQRGWHRVAVTGGPAHARTDPRRLGAVVTNLVGNALRHGAEPVTVDLT